MEKLLKARKTECNLYDHHSANSILLQISDIAFVDCDLNRNRRFDFSFLSFLGMVFVVFVPLPDHILFSGFAPDKKELEAGAVPGRHSLS